VLLGNRLRLQANVTLWMGKATKSAATLKRLPHFCSWSYWKSCEGVALIGDIGKGADIGVTDAETHAGGEFAALAALYVPLENRVGLCEASLQAKQFPSGFLAGLSRLADSFTTPVPMVKGVLTIV
jgi:hypothetical protein